MEKSTEQQKGRLLLIGKKPLPIGGVTRHVERLESHLIDSDINFIYKPLTVLQLLNPKNYFTNSQIHIHASHALVIFWLSLISKLTNTKSIFTLHENLVKLNGIKRAFIYLSFKIADKPLVLNVPSYEGTKGWNAKTQLIGSFLPPTDIQQLPQKTLQEIDELKSSYKHVFCTNAFNHKLDENGKEIYQITKLVELFNKLDNAALIVSDPSANNLKVCSQLGEIGKNILFVSFPHDSIPIIKMSDGLIRATTTDGDSVSVKEALYYDIPVITTDVIDRPESCIIYKSENYKELEDILTSFDRDAIQINKPTSCFGELIDLYKSN